MFPYLLIWPVLLFASLIWPTLQSLKALHSKDQKEMRVWLFYWLAYAGVEILFALPFVEMVLSIPLTLIIDIYYEAQLALVIALVNPKSRQLDTLIKYVDEHGEPYIEKALQQLSVLTDQIAAKVPAVAALLTPPSAPAAASKKSAGKDGAARGSGGSPKKSGEKKID